MKTLIFTLAALVSTMPAFSQGWYNNNNYNYPGNTYTYTNSNTTLNIHSTDNANISVLVDGNVQSAVGTNVQVNFGAPGNHSLMITKYIQMNPYWRTNQVIYNGFVNMQQGMNATAVVDQFGHLVINQSPSASAGYNNCNGGNGYNNYNGNGGYGNYSNGNYNGSYGNGNYNGGYGNGNYNNGGWGNAYMSDADFNQFKQSVAAKPFDDTKKQVAFQVIHTKSMSARQVAELMKVFSFESTRLEVAKEAYLYSQDRANFYIVNDAFTFSSSIDELNTFINQHS